MIKKYTLLGDVHAEFFTLLQAMKANKNTNAFIQCGDFGAFWDGKNPGFTGKLDRPVHFIPGNHDNYNFFDNEQNYKDWPKNLFYVPRNTHWENPSINFLGGAESIDKINRIPNVNFWDREIPSYKEFNDFLELPAADTWVTHTAPLSVVATIGFYKSKDPVSHALQNIWEQTDHKPKLWFFGHFHGFLDKIINGTRFICLPCTHDHFFYDANGHDVTIDGYPGVTVTYGDNGEILDVNVPPTKEKYPVRKWSY